LLARQRRRLHELALETLLSTGSKDYALVAHHARGAGRYLDMVEAARRGLHVYMGMGSPYQALQLAEMGLDELPDDVELLSCGARAAWLAGLLDDAQELGRRWLAAAATRAERADALRLLVRLSWEIGSSVSMQERAAHLRAEIAPPRRRPAKAHAYAAIARRTCCTTIPSGAQRLADMRSSLGEELGQLPPSLAGGSTKRAEPLNVAGRLETAAACSRSTPRRPHGCPGAARSVSSCSMYAWAIAAYACAFAGPSSRWAISARSWAGPAPAC